MPTTHVLHVIGGGVDDGLLEGLLRGVSLLSEGVLSEGVSLEGVLSEDV